MIYTRTLAYASLMIFAVSCQKRPVSIGSQLTDARPSTFTMNSGCSHHAEDITVTARDRTIFIESKTYAHKEIMEFDKKTGGLRLTISTPEPSTTTKDITLKDEAYKTTLDKALAKVSLIIKGNVCTAPQSSANAVLTSLKLLKPEFSCFDDKTGLSLELNASKGEAKLKKADGSSEQGTLTMVHAGPAWTMDLPSVELTCARSLSGDSSKASCTSFLGRATFDLKCSL